MAGNPQRMCAACRTRGGKEDFFRVVKTEQGAVLDEKQKLPGRGAYLCRSAECLKKARRGKALTRALGIPVDDGYYERLEEKLDG